jgi:hypothetical protein
MTSIIIKHSFVALNLNRCQEQLFLNKVLNFVYVIIMTIPRDALNSVVNSSYIYIQNVLFYDTRVEFTWRCFRVSLGDKVTEGVIRFCQRLSRPSARPGDKSCLNFRKSFWSLHRMTGPGLIRSWISLIHCLSFWEGPEKWNVVQLYSGASFEWFKY